MKIERTEDLETCRAIRRAVFVQEQNVPEDEEWDGLDGAAVHLLARDDQGRYFYVDRGNTPETEKSFRLFVGPKGAMKLQKMTNAVADTEGEIFTTKSGSLRYVTDRKNPPVWIQGGKKTKLTVVPLEGTDANGEPVNNYQLIYNDLGVYLGERLGNPCDDL